MWACCRRPVYSTNGVRRIRYANYRSCLHLTARAISYGGHCTICRREHFLQATDQAQEAALKLMQRMEQERRLDYDSVDADERFGIDYLWSKGPGRMFGVLICESCDGQVHTFKAFSGQITGCWNVAGWAGPVVGLTSDTQLYSSYQDLINYYSRRLLILEGRMPKSGTAKGTSTSKGSNSNCNNTADSCMKLRHIRKRLSYELWDLVQGSYASQNFHGEALLLRDVYTTFLKQKAKPLPKLGFPAGTGDCCAPKLLHRASIQGLRPLGLAEFWFGSEPNSHLKQRPGASGATASRVHKHFYSSCPKCDAILGTMLCGHDRILRHV